jgi:hypothetical protein
VTERITGKNQWMENLKIKNQNQDPKLEPKE